MTHSDDANSPFAHLIPAVRPIIDLPVKDRIRFTREDRWVEYPDATRAIKKLADMLDHPEVLRNRFRLLAARADNGKTSLLRRFRALNPATTLETGDTKLPVLLMSMPDKPDEWKFWTQMLKGFRVPFSTRDPARDHKERAFDLIRTQHVDMLVIDEIHNLLEGNAKDGSHALTLLKMVSNELTIPIVAAGTERALRALATDEQTETRFQPIALRRWRMTQDTRTFLSGMESVLPLAEPSDLASREMVTALLTRSYETVGGLVFLLQEATVLALQSGKERLDIQLVAEVDHVTLKSLGEDKKLDL